MLPFSLFLLPIPYSDYRMHCENWRGLAARCLAQEKDWATTRELGQGVKKELVLSEDEGAGRPDQGGEMQGEAGAANKAGEEEEDDEEDFTSDLGSLDDGLEN